MTKQISIKEQRMIERGKKLIKKLAEKAGGQVLYAAKLAKETKKPINQSHISNMINVYKSLQPPAELVIAMERIEKGETTRHQIRADIYPYEPPDVYPVKYPHGAKTLLEWFDLELDYRLKTDAFDRETAYRLKNKGRL